MKNGAYYNEFDPFAAQWLRCLIAKKLIADGDVDDRDFWQVEASDLDGYTQAHFFAGIGGWSYALRIAGWPDDRPVWTASLPCQPFSSAGRAQGVLDPRHLWPPFQQLLTERSAPTLFGEQVASAGGRAWFSGVRADLEALGYAVGAADLPAASVGAPHRRGRIFFVADPEGSRWRMGQAADQRTPNREIDPSSDDREPVSLGREARAHVLDEICRVDNAMRDGRDARSSDVQAGRNPARRSSPWGDFNLVSCRDHKGRADVQRRVEWGTFPLADGFPGRVEQLRGYGNAIVPAVAAEFVSAFMDL